MKLIFTDLAVLLPHKMKKEVEKSLIQIIETNKGSVADLHKVKIGNNSAPGRDYSIYSVEKTDTKKFGLPANTNYIAGKITKGIIYFVNIGELIWITDGFKIMLGETEKLVINVKSI